MPRKPEVHNNMTGGLDFENGGGSPLVYVGPVPDPKDNIAETLNKLARHLRTDDTNRVLLQICGGSEKLVERITAELDCLIRLCNGTREMLRKNNKEPGGNGALPLWRDGLRRIAGYIIDNCPKTTEEAA